MPRNPRCVTLLSGFGADAKISVARGCALGNGTPQQQRGHPKQSQGDRTDDKCSTQGVHLRKSRVFKEAVFFLCPFTVAFLPQMLSDEENRVHTNEVKGEEPADVTDYPVGGDLTPGDSLYRRGCDPTVPDNL